MAIEKVDGLTVTQWFKKVDVIVNQKCGVGVRDLADFCIWDCWQDGMTPEEGAVEALENDDLPWLDE